MATEFDEKLKAEIAAKYNKSIKSDKTLSALKQKIRSGTATQKDVARYSELLGTHARDAFMDVIPPSLSDSKLYTTTADATIRPVMQDVHRKVNAAGIVEQRFEDKKAGLNISIVKGKDGAIDSMIHNVCDADDAASALNSQTVTTSRKFYDDFQIENVAARSKMGYDMYVTRTYDDVGLHGKGEICQYCKDREGTFEYPSEANDVEVFARHPGCGCTITFTTDNGTMKQTNWKHNEWK